MEKKKERQKRPQNWKQRESHVRLLLPGTQGEVQTKRVTNGGQPKEVEKKD